ncbi:MAG TPA: GNAT family N-acetyltransferase, partial [Bacilli bacterium]|nr:GNAT family N-acetyltransferase [Bacilli bacterium]
MDNKLPVLTTSRLILREISDNDYLDMFEYAKIPYVGPAAGWQPHKSVAETKAVIKMFQGKRKYGQLGVFAIVLKSTNKMIGTIELHTYTMKHKAELGYTLSPSFWGQG